MKQEYTSANTSINKNRIPALFTMSKPTATIYITVYEGDKTGIGKQTKTDCYQLNRKTAGYIEEISMVFPHVERHGKLIICNKIGDKYNV